jgi:hypothetical protein
MTATWLKPDKLTHLDPVRIFQYDPAPTGLELESFTDWMLYEGGNITCLQFKTSTVLEDETALWKVYFSFLAPASENPIWLLADSGKAKSDDSFSPSLSRIASLRRSPDEHKWPSQTIEVQKVILASSDVFNPTEHEAFGGRLTGISGFSPLNLTFTLTFAPVVKTYTTGTHYMQVLMILAKLGGFFTLMRIAYGMAFPIRYHVAVERTLIGHVDKRPLWEIREENDSNYAEMSDRDSISNSE